MQSVYKKREKKAVISLSMVNFTQKLYQDVQLELLQHQIKFHPDQLKRIDKNLAKRFCFVLILWPSAKVKVSESGMK